MKVQISTDSAIGRPHNLFSLKPTGAVPESALAVAGLRLDKTAMDYFYHRLYWLMYRHCWRYRVRLTRARFDYISTLTLSQPLGELRR